MFALDIIKQGSQYIQYFRVPYAQIYKKLYINKTTLYELFSAILLLESFFLTLRKFSYNLVVERTLRVQPTYSLK